MAQSSVIHARIDPATKAKTERILDSLGLTPTEAIRLFYRQIALRGEFPLELHLPNRTTAETLHRADRGEDVESFSNTKDLYDSWEACGLLRHPNSRKTSRNKVSGAKTFKSSRM